jgi:glycosyltransferase involved in cell wall biosynthesis
MKIAQIPPLYESVPPRLYGGTERIVHYLTEELVELGHELTLFATADSKTKGRLISNVNEGLRLDKKVVDPLTHHIVQMQEVIERIHEFDILHFHTDYLHFPFTQKINVPCVTTLHGRLDIIDLQSVYNKFPSQRVISISESQKLPLPQANWIGTVHHGLPRDLLMPGDGSGGYLAFIGRVSPEKGIDRAIEIAVASGSKIKIAAKIDKADQEYFDDHIKILLDHPLVEFIGEINEVQKSEFLGKAQALLFPIIWAEPFGLVMVEAMACGTPVIAFRNGSVPEVLEEGKTGFIVESIAEGIKAVSKIGKISRLAVRQAFEERFTASIMAEKYMNLYSLTIEDFRNKEDESLKLFNRLPSFPQKKKDLKIVIE